VSFIDSVRARAKANRRRIVLPEADDPRTIEAARALAESGVVEPVLVGPVTGTAPCEVIDPSAGDLFDRVAALLLERRAAKGMTESQAAKLARSPLIVADALVRWGVVDGCVAGAVHTTADVMRAEAIPVARTLRDGDAWNQFDQARRHAAGRNRVDDLAAENALLRRALDVDERRFAGDGDGFRHAADSQIRVDGSREGAAQLDAFAPYG